MTNPTQQQNYQPNRQANQPNQPKQSNPFDPKAKPDDKDAMEKQGMEKQGMEKQGMEKQGMEKQEAEKQGKNSAWPSKDQSNFRPVAGSNSGNNENQKANEPRRAEEEVAESK